MLRSFAQSRGGSRLPELLNAAFNPTIVFDQTAIPTYKRSPLPEGLNDSYLHQELAKLYLFTQGHPRRAAKLTPRKEQMILAQILSYLHPGEAEILVAVLTKSLTQCVPGLTAGIAKDAFPNLPYEVSPSKAKKDKAPHASSKKHSAVAG